MHGYVKGISISAVIVEAKAVRQVKYALFTLSMNTPRKRMIMSVHCTIKSYQNIFLLLPPHNGQRKYATHFVSKLVGLFSFLTWGLVIWLLLWPFFHALMIELLCLEASAPYLWPMTNERTGVCLGNTLLSIFFHPAELSLTCAILSCQMSKYCHILQGFGFFW